MRNALKIIACVTWLWIALRVPMRRNVDSVILMTHSKIAGFGMSLLLHHQYVIISLSILTCKSGYSVNLKYNFLCLCWRLFDGKLSQTKVTPNWRSRTMLQSGSRRAFLLEVRSDRSPPPVPWISSTSWQTTQTVPSALQSFFITSAAVCSSVAIIQKN